MLVLKRRRYRLPQYNLPELDTYIQNSDAIMANVASILVENLTVPRLVAAVVVPS
jgi:hypothetical protein